MFDSRVNTSDLDFEQRRITNSISADGGKTVKNIPISRIHSMRRIRSLEGRILKNENAIIRNIRQQPQPENVSAFGRFKNIGAMLFRKVPTQEDVCQIIENAEPMASRKKSAALSPYAPLPPIKASENFESDESEDSVEAKQRPKLIRELTYSVLNPKFVKGPTEREIPPSPGEQERKSSRFSLPNFLRSRLSFGSNHSIDKQDSDVEDSKSIDGASVKGVESDGNISDAGCSETSASEVKIKKSRKSRFKRLSDDSLKNRDLSVQQERGDAFWFDFSTM